MDSEIDVIDADSVGDIPREVLSNIRGPRNQTPKMNEQLSAKSARVSFRTRDEIAIYCAIRRADHRRSTDDMKSQPI